MIKVVSFNVNSIRVRLNGVMQFLEEHQPDIIGLQETKVVDNEFPEEPFADTGYTAHYFGQKTYHGVAMLSLDEPTKLQKGYKTDTEKDQKRFILGHFDLPNGEELVVINGYFPQGESNQHETKYPAKMKFYKDLMTLLREDYSPDQNLIVMGDLNIAPTDLDVGIGDVNAKRWLKTGKCSFLPEEREKIEELKEWGLYDTFREKYPESTDLSWFDFRSRGFHAEPKRGLRIDQIWATKSALEKCTDAGIDYVLRSGDKPSDHCPIWADFDF